MGCFQILSFSFWCLTLLNTSLILNSSTALTSITPLYPGSHSLYLIVILIPLLFLLDMLCWFFFLYFLLFPWNTLFILALPSGHSHDLSCHSYVNDSQVTTHWFLPLGSRYIYLYSIAYRVSSMSTMRKRSSFDFSTSFYVIQICLISWGKNIGKILDYLSSRSRKKIPSLLWPYPALFDSVCCC